MPDAFDLQQIGKLFDDAIAAIRNGTPDMDALKPQAVGWLKGARYQLIRDVEEAYYELEQACDKPLLLPPWVVEPVKKLRLFTEDVPAVLEPFKSAMGGNLNNLLKDCGFQSRYGTYSGGIWLEIHFPTQHTAQNAKAPRSLHVEDEFSSQTATGVNPFTRLIAKAQASASGDADSSRNIRFRSALEEEKDFKKIFRACSFSNTATPVPSIVPPGRRSTSGVAGFFADGLQQAETKVDFPPDAVAAPSEVLVPAQKQRTSGVTNFAVQTGEKKVRFVTDTVAATAQSIRVPAEKQHTGDLVNFVADDPQKAASPSTLEQESLKSTTQTNQPLEKEKRNLEVKGAELSEKDMFSMFWTVILAGAMVFWMEARRDVYLSR